MACRLPFPYWLASAHCWRALAHIAVRWRLPYADPVLLPCVIVLNGLGLAMIHRIDLINEPPLNGARQQLIWTALGVIMFILIVWSSGITDRCSASPTPSA